MCEIRCSRPVQEERVMGACLLVATSPRPSGWWLHTPLSLLMFRACLLHAGVKESRDYSMRWLFTTYESVTAYIMCLMYQTNQSPIWVTNHAALPECTIYLYECESGLYPAVFECVECNGKSVCAVFKASGDRLLVRGGELGWLGGWLDQQGTGNWGTVGLVCGWVGVRLCVSEWNYRPAYVYSVFII